MRKRKIARPVCFVKQNKLFFREGEDNTKLKSSANSTGWNCLPIRIKIQIYEWLSLRKKRRRITLIKSISQSRRLALRLRLGSQLYFSRANDGVLVHGVLEAVESRILKYLFKAEARKEHSCQTFFASHIGPRANLVAFSPILLVFECIFVFKLLKVVFWVANCFESCPTTARFWLKNEQFCGLNSGWQQ